MEAKIRLRDQFILNACNISSRCLTFSIITVGIASIFFLANDILSSNNITNFFLRFLNDDTVKFTLGNTFYLWIISLLIQFSLLFASTMFIRHISMAIRILLLIPFACGSIAPALSFYIFFSTALGPITGKSLLDMHWGARAIIATIDAWQWTGILFIATYSLLDRLPQSIFEQCTLERINLVQQWKFIVFPQIKWMIGLYSLFKFLDWLRKIDTIQAIFDSGGPGHSVETFSMYVSKLYFGSDSSYASTLIFLQLAVFFIVVCLILNRMRHATE